MLLPTAAYAAAPDVVPLPVSGVAAQFPGTVQAEDFDNGGDNIAYGDGTSGNTGGKYRQTNVDIESATEGSYNVGWITAGEWLNYSVNVTVSGTYLLEARVAAKGKGGTFHVEFAGADATGSLAIPDTGGWQAWQTVSHLVTLVAGQQNMRIGFDLAGVNSVGNFNWIRVSPAPYGVTAATLPGSVRVEQFDNGGEGVAYHDYTAGNRGGQVRQTDVDIERSSLGGYNVGWISDGEWLSYAVNVKAPGAYILQFTVASLSPEGRMHAVVGEMTTAIVAVPYTGGWQNWTTISVPATLIAGAQSLRVIFDTGRFNLGAINVVPVPPPSLPQSAGNVWMVHEGQDLQAALNGAQGGDTILLQAGATFIGNFVLPLKTGPNTDYITIRSSAPDALLPGATTRLTPAAAPQLPKLRSPNGLPAMATAPGAHHYRLLFLEFLANLQGNGDIVTLGDGSAAQNTLAFVPHDLIVDRCYLHGDVTYGQKRGIALNSASTSVINSYIAEMKRVGQDSQAVGGWNGPGPFTIVNNYLEAAGENIMFGGADPAIPNLVPSDITVRGNHLTKPLAWRTQNWTIKNLFELKNAQRVVIDGNLMENNWLSAQTGYAVLFTVRNQDGTAPWSVVQHVQFTNNIVRHVASGISILGNDDNQSSQQTNDILIRNNLFEDMSAARYGGSGYWVLITGGRDITIDHNTVLQDGVIVVAAGAPVQNFVFTNNIVADYGWAIFGTGSAAGNTSIGAFFPNSTFLGGIFAGSNPAKYPAGNYYPATLEGVGFVNLGAGNYRLAPTSVYRNSATDGRDVGCDIDALNAATGAQY